MGDLKKEVEQLIQSGKNTQALELINKLIELNDNKEEWLEKRADTYYKLGEFGKALNDYNKILKTNKDNKIIGSKAEMVHTILKFQNLDIFESTNLNLDPWDD